MSSAIWGWEASAEISTMPELPPWLVNFTRSRRSSETARRCGVGAAGSLPRRRPTQSVRSPR